MSERRWTDMHGDTLVIEHTPAFARRLTYVTVERRYASDTTAYGLTVALTPEQLLEVGEFCTRMTREIVGPDTSKPLQPLPVEGVMYPPVDDEPAPEPGLDEAVVEWLTAEARAASYRASLLGPSQALDAATARAQAFTEVLAVCTNAGKTLG